MNDPTWFGQAFHLQRALLDHAGNREALRKAAQFLKDRAPMEKLLEDMGKIALRLAVQEKKDRVALDRLLKAARPEELKQTEAALLRAIRRRLIDPSVVQVSYSADGPVSAVTLNVHITATTPVDNRPTPRATLHYNCATKETRFSWTGHTVRACMPYTQAAVLAEWEQCWQTDPNRKGVPEKIKQREPIARRYAALLHDVCKDLSGAWGQASIDGAVIEDANLYVKCAYRSDLPKEGAYSVGEYAYGDMVKEEIKRCRDRLRRAFGPEFDKIQCSITDEEKGWIYIGLRVDV